MFLSSSQAYLCIVLWLCFFSVFHEAHSTRCFEVIREDSTEALIKTGALQENEWERLTTLLADSQFSALVSFVRDLNHLSLFLNLTIVWWNQKPQIQIQIADVNYFVVKDKNGFYTTRRQPDYEIKILSQDEDDKSTLISRFAPPSDMFLIAIESSTKGYLVPIFSPSPWLTEY